jgi:hypothetical protein
MNLGILTVCPTYADASRPTIKRPVDIGKKNGRTATKVSDYNQRAGYCQTVWANSQGSKIHEFSGWSMDG